MIQKQKTFADNAVLQKLAGPLDENFIEITRKTGVSIQHRGNTLTLTHKDVAAIQQVLKILDFLYERAKTMSDINTNDIENALNTKDTYRASDLTLRTKKKHINPRTETQGAFIEAMNTHEMVFGIGPAGTGKTYLAVAKAVSAMLDGTVDRIILTRPAVEAGENLGFLPGDLKEKIDPYLRPLYDALYEMLPADIVEKKLESGEIEIAPLAYMRGRTLAHSMVILDEAQNTTAMQMKMFLTRLGEGSRMVINGDLTQTDLPRGVQSGLNDAINILKNVPEIAFITFTEKDVVRHGLVSKIVKAYDQARKEG